MCDELFFAVKQICDALGESDDIDCNQFVEHYRIIKEKTEKLENELSKKRWLTGPAVTLADINCIAVLRPAFVKMFDKEFIMSHPFLSKWFYRFQNLPQV